MELVSIILKYLYAKRSKFEILTINLKFNINFINVIDRNITQNIPLIIKTKINNEVFKIEIKLLRR